MMKRFLALLLVCLCLFSNAFAKELDDDSLEWCGWMVLNEYVYGVEVPHDKVFCTSIERMDDGVVDMRFEVINGIRDRPRDTIHMVIDQVESRFKFHVVSIVQFDNRFKQYLIHKFEDLYYDKENENE